MNETLQLLRMVHCINEQIHVNLTDNQSVRLYKCAIRNKMALFYLEILRKSSGLFALQSAYDLENTKYTKSVDAIVRVSGSLSSKGINHAVFKTVRPYKSATADIDVLIFNQDSYSKSLKATEEAGYRMIVRGPMSATFWDEDAQIGIDLYEQIAVSYIAYIDIAKLKTYVKNTKLENGKNVPLLGPEADLACIIAHSVIKEQMYTLSEYYSYLYYLKQMDVNQFLDIVRQNNITVAARVHTTITARLCQMINGIIPFEFQRILKDLNTDCLEVERLVANNFATPHKYHPITVARSLLEIAKGKRTRDSMARQVYELLNPNFSGKFLGAFLEHVIRETY